MSVVLDVITFARINRYMCEFEAEFALAAGYSEVGPQAGLADVMGWPGPLEVPVAFYGPLFDCAVNSLTVLGEPDTLSYSDAVRVCKAVARAALAVIYPAL